MEPGLNRYTWESEMSGLEEDLETSPAETLPELDQLVARMLDEAEVDDPDLVTEFDAAHAVTDALERRSDGVSPGDVAAAINSYRAVFDAVVSRNARST